MDWEAPNTGSGTITFYGAFIAGNGDGHNSGDTYHTATYTDGSKAYPCVLMAC